MTCDELTVTGWSYDEVTMMHYISCTLCQSTVESNWSCAYWCTVHISAGVQSIWHMFLSQLQSTIFDQVCVPYLPYQQLHSTSSPVKIIFLCRATYQLTFRTYLTPQLSRNV